MNSPTTVTRYALDTFVVGRPAAQGSKRHVGKGVLIEQSKAVGPWRTLVAWHVAQVWLHRAPLDGPVALKVEFVMPRPRSAPKRSTPAAIKRPDIDKMIRALLDAMTGICWRDDSQVVQVWAFKRMAEIDEQAGCRIQVGPVETTPVAVAS